MIKIPRQVDEQPIQIIPSNDMWVAAQAMETGTELATYDTHFGNVEGLVSIHLGEG